MNHEAIERNAGLVAVLTALVISVAGLVEIVPLYFATESVTPNVQPASKTALLAARSLQALLDH